MTNLLDALDDPNIAESYDLDHLTQDRDYQPPGKIADLISSINRAQCWHAQAVQLANGHWFLRWVELHPEMPPVEEYLGDAYCGMNETATAARNAILQLADDLPPKQFELPMTSRQAFALVAACALEGFDDELAALIR